MSENIAHRNLSTNLTTGAKFFSTLEKQGVSFENFALPIQDIKKRKRLADYLKRGCPKFDSEDTAGREFSDFELARLILYREFITPGDIMKDETEENDRGLIYTKEQLESLEESFPSLEKIMECRRKGAILIPSPPKAMSFREIYDLYPWALTTYHRDKDQCPKKNYINEKFMDKDKTKAAEWIIADKSIVFNSTGKNLWDQLELVTSIGRVPNIAELSWVMITYRIITGLYMFGGLYARTSSFTLEGDCVEIVSSSCGISVRHNSAKEANEEVCVSLFRNL